MLGVESSKSSTFLASCGGGGRAERDRLLDLAMPIGSICSPFNTPLWPFQMGGEHLHKEQQEHQSNNAEDHDQDYDGNRHEHVDTSATVCEAVLHLFIFLEAATVDLTVTEQLPLNALRLFCTWAPLVVVIVGRAVLLERSDHQLQLFVGLALFCGVHNKPEIHFFVHVLDVFPASPGSLPIIKPQQRTILSQNPSS